MTEDKRPAVRRGVDSGETGPEARTSTQMYDWTRPNELADGIAAPA